MLRPPIVGVILSRDREEGRTRDAYSRVSVSVVETKVGVCRLKESSKDLRVIESEFLRRMARMVQGCLLVMPASEYPEKKNTTKARDASCRKSPQGAAR